MKVLVVSPTEGGIDVYVQTIIRYLRKHKDLKIDFFSTSMNGKIYDPISKSWSSLGEVVKVFNGKVRNVQWDTYDFILLHYGKNDVEQLIPLYLQSINFPFKKLIYFVHYLSWNLFKDFIVDNEYASLVESTTLKIPSLFFFGEFAKNYWIRNYGVPEKYLVDFLPETHSHETFTKEDVHKLFHAASIEIHTKPSKIIWAGYPSNYKNHQLLLDSIKYIRNPMHIIFAGRGWSKRIGQGEYSSSDVIVSVIDKELSSKEYKICSSISDIGVFLYQQPKKGGEVFQGSGTLPNYLYEGKPCVVLDEGAMAEYVQEAGIILKSQNLMAVAKSIDRLVGEDNDHYSKLALARRVVFSPELHVSRIYNFLKYLRND